MLVEKSIEKVDALKSSFAVFFTALFFNFYYVEYNFSIKINTQGIPFCLSLITFRIWHFSVMNDQQKAIKLFRRREFT